MNEDNFTLLGNRYESADFVATQEDSYKCYLCDCSRWSLCDKAPQCAKGKRKDGKNKIFKRVAL